MGTRAKSEIPEMARAGGADVPPGWTLKKTGCNSSDVVALVRAVRAGVAEGLTDREAWLHAKESAGATIQDKGLEAWREEVLRRAGRPVDEPVPPPKPEPLRAVAAPDLPAEVLERLDVALAALVASRGDLAMQVLRELGAEATRAPDGWAERLTARAPRIPRAAPPRAATPATAEPPEAGEDAAAPAMRAELPAPPAARAKRTPKARRSA